MSSKQIEVNIAGQPYKFAVSADNEAALCEAGVVLRPMVGYGLGHCLRA